MKRFRIHRKPLLTILVIGVVACGFLGRGLARRTPARTSSSAIGVRTGPEAAADQQMEQRLRALAAEEARRDQTVWAPEVLAEEYEGVFTRLWDQLRTAPDPAQVMEDFQFGELLLGRLGDPELAEQRIVIRHLVPPAERVVPQTWRELVARLKQDGFRLEQSEWRQEQFRLATNGTATSRLALTLHLLQPEPETRFVVRGTLDITWRGRTQPGLDPFPESIAATNLTVLSRQGAPPFDHKVVAEITPENRETETLDPSLHLYDLDGDGLSEIVLPRRNLVFWNQGQGHFRLEKLLETPPPNLNGCLLADFDGDGHADLLAADAQGLMLFRGNAQGHFRMPGERVMAANPPLINPLVMTAGDIDGDGDLDVWLAQYKVPYRGGQVPTPYFDANDGYPGYLLINDGAGHFTDGTEAAGLASKRFRRTYSSAFVDLDGDGDLDLVVVSDFAGADVYYNDGRGHFRDVTRQVLDEPHAFGMSQTFGDYDLDGRLDLLVIGMNSYAAERLESAGLGLPGHAALESFRPAMAYGNRLYFHTDSGFKQNAVSDQVARSGWSWGVTSGDFDNDGDEDVYIVNGHISGRSARDYETEFWRRDIYLGSSQDDPALDYYFGAAQSRYYASGFSYGGYEKNRLFLNRSGRAFLEAGYLMGVALEVDCRNVVCDDLDGDGNLDLVVTSFQVWPQIRQELHVFRNLAPEAGNWIGVRLRESGPGLSPVGAKVSLTTSRGRQIRQLVTGDSYCSQHANTAHFGLGRETAVVRLEVRWPNGQRTVLDRPAVNRYHTVTPQAH